MGDLSDFATGLLILLVTFVFTVSGILLLLKLFPGFVSREKKEGQYRSEDLRKIDPASTKLPNLGGIAALVSLTVTLTVASYLNLVDASFRWFLLPIWGFSIVGLLDDYRKTQGKGISERTKLIYVFGLSFILTFILYTRFGFNSPYLPYSLVSYFAVPIIWAIWFMFMSTTITVGTTLSVGFSDGIDGLLGGLWLIASLAYAIPTTINQATIASAISFSLAGAAAGFLLFNLPSSWSSGQPRSKRRGRIYLGETGSMMVGSSFAFLAILSQTELAWIVIGGVFVLEGATALYQAKILTPLFRRTLSLPKHLRNGIGKDFPHTEFPLPFLATPYHCHLDLIGLGRLRIVLLLWSLGFALAILGSSTLLVYDLFGKAVLWLMGITLISFFWLFGTWTKSVFLGFHDSISGEVCVSINRGRPYKLFGLRVYWTEERIELRKYDIVQSELLFDVIFWKTMSKSDALLVVGYLYFQMADYAQATVQWDRVPERTLKAHKEIYSLYTQAKEIISREHRLDGETRGEEAITELSPLT